MKFVTLADKKEINRLYKELKTYAAVSRKTGFSPATVKKYIVDSPVDTKDESQFKRFDRPLTEPDYSIFRKDDWGDLCKLTEEEMSEISNLWEEIEF